MTPRMRSFLIGFAAFTVASSLPAKRDNFDSKVLYDQRQEGDWNVRADLDNFVILIIPTQTASNTPPSSPSLLDFLTKSLKSRRSHFKRPKHVKKHKPDSSRDPMTHFIESKTAPYHVDITKAKTQLGSILPVPGVKSQPENPVLKKRVVRSNKKPRVFLVTVPSTEDEREVMKGKISKLDNIIASESFPVGDLKLLGAENEQCGPGLVRDITGVCKISKDID